MEIEVYFNSNGRTWNHTYDEDDIIRLIRHALVEEDLECNAHIVIKKISINCD